MMGLEQDYDGPGNETMMGLGTRLRWAWERDYDGPGNEANTTKINIVV